ncbi:hypothetical protein M5K25_020651 [Dendrobium thyrsiflorum]|uniref:Uncharacterized protein n=1 Tax=Dendrobium thyrsiflorum TaxID=117978 RepID=A0ABD0UAG8_DENTH
MIWQAVSIPWLVPKYLDLPPPTPLEASDFDCLRDHDYVRVNDDDDVDDDEHDGDDRQRRLEKRKGRKARPFQLRRIG